MGVIHFLVCSSIEGEMSLPFTSPFIMKGAAKRCENSPTRWKRVCSFVVDSASFRGLMAWEHLTSRVIAGMGCSFGFEFLLILFSPFSLSVPLHYIVTRNRYL